MERGAWQATAHGVGKELDMTEHIHTTDLFHDLNYYLYLRDIKCELIGGVQFLNFREEKTGIKNLIWLIQNHTAWQSSDQKLGVLTLTLAIIYQIVFFLEKLFSMVSQICNCVLSPHNL